jgi:hypothetical protein
VNNTDPTGISTYSLAETGFVLSAWSAMGGMMDALYGVVDGIAGAKVSQYIFNTKGNYDRNRTWEEYKALARQSLNVQHEADKAAIFEYYSDYGTLGDLWATLATSGMDFAKGAMDGVHDGDFGFSAFISSILNLGTGTGYWVGSGYSINEIQGLGQDLTTAASVGLALSDVWSLFRTGCFTEDARVGYFVGDSIVEKHSSIKDLVHTFETGAEIKVTARDEATGKEEIKKVTNAWERLVQDVVTVEFYAKGDDNKTVVETITGTLEHPFMTSKGWIGMGSLGIGTEILTRAGPRLVVKSVTRKYYADGVKVYNFTVDGKHTYFVGDSLGGAWVHNAKCKLARQQLKNAISNGLHGLPNIDIRIANYRDVLKAGIAQGWSVSDTHSGKGFVLKDANGIERVRFMSRGGGDAYGQARADVYGGYYRFQNAAGQDLDINGNVVPRTHPNFNKKVHIEYQYDFAFCIRLDN